MLLAEVKQSAVPIIIFIDEAHTLIGSGTEQSDIANLLKPALARGEMHVVGATTLDEYQKYIEKYSFQFQKVLKSLFFLTAGILPLQVRLQ